MFKRALLVAFCLCLTQTAVAQQTSQTSGAQRTAILSSVQLPQQAPSRDQLSALTKLDQDKLDRSPVPVLVLSNIREFAKSNLIVQDMYYAASFGDTKHSVSVQGSILTYNYPELTFARSTEKTKIRSTTGFITESEGIWTASWEEFGAAYVLSVECATADDRRCGSEDYVRRLADSLVYVGGGRAVPKLLAAPSDETSSLISFSYNPPGQLVTGSGTGRRDGTVYAPGIRFPIEVKPAYANSQVWNPGGQHGPAGGQCHKNNYSFPWSDNFCETRGRTTPMCPTSKGHQGQDIRPSTCEKNKHNALSASDGTVTNIGSYSVFITAPDGTQYRYLHMSNVAVSLGGNVKKADRVGRVSNVFTAPTTIHLHFEILQNIGGLGFVQVPPYMSLVKAYERLP